MWGRLKLDRAGVLDLVDWDNYAPTLPDVLARAERHAGSDHRDGRTETGRDKIEAAQPM